jgi:hypothetical protein
MNKIFYTIIFFVSSIIIIFICIFSQYSSVESFANTRDYIFEKPLNWKDLSFTDKLKIYGANLDERYAFFADKYRVKEYIRKLNIPNLNVSKTIKVLDKNNDKLELTNLPKNCVIKSNHGSGDIIIIKDSKIKLMKCGGQYKSYSKWLKNSLIPHKTKYETHYTKIKPEIFVEESLGDDINDYKFFCFHGKVKLLQVDFNRFSGHGRNLYDDNFNFTNVKFIYDNNPNINLDKHKLEILKNIAETISKPFEFARVDLYLIKNSIYFGEITFCPEAANGKFEPNDYDDKLGKYWK